MKRRLRLLALLCAPLVIGCPQIAHVWLEPNATNQHLSFGIGRTPSKPGGVAIGVFRVDPCQFRDGSQPAWVISDNTADDKTGHVEYGRIPSGFSEDRKAIPLAPGCYQASVSGSPGRIAFDILPSGEVRARSEPK
jgi:hypothetical protein